MKNYKIYISIALAVGIGGFFLIKNIKESSYEEITYDNILEESKSKQNKGDIIVVHITGEIKNEGVIELEEGSRIIDAINEAGGLTENADVSKINLAFVLSDGQKIYIPSVDDEEIEEYVLDGIGKQDVLQGIGKKVNINTATEKELEQITGVGPSTAIKIINYRKQNGKFKTIEDIKNVSGIGDTKYEIIKDEICV